MLRTLVAEWHVVAKSAAKSEKWPRKAPRKENFGNIEPLMISRSLEGKTPPVEKRGGVE